MVSWDLQIESLKHVYILGHRLVSHKQLLEIEAIIGMHDISCITDKELFKIVVCVKHYSHVIRLAPSVV